jgi:hypothetical protein
MTITRQLTFRLKPKHIEMPSRRRQKRSRWGHRPVKRRRHFLQAAIRRPPASLQFVQRSLIGVGVSKRRLSKKSRGSLSHVEPAQVASALPLAVGRQRPRYIVNITTTRGDPIHRALHRPAHDLRGLLARRGMDAGCVARRWYLGLIAPSPVLALQLSLTGPSDLPDLPQS